MKSFVIKRAAGVSAARVLLVAAGAFGSGVIGAAEDAAAPARHAPTAANAPAAAKVIDAAGGAADRLVSKLQALRPGIPIERVSKTPVPNIYALEITGGTVYYGTADGRYLFAGDLYELGDDDLVNLAEAGRIELRRELMAAVPRDEMVIFSPAGPTKAAVNVFTDVDCGYCQKFHQEVPALNKMGVEVRYLAYPRAGVGSVSYDKIVSAWCADDPNAALTRLKVRQPIPEARCPNPVADQYELGREIGVTGTPAIVFDDGRLLPGYLPAEELAKAAGL